ncbi:SDR family NAD(P)-dependent oxidoreductase [Pseudoalteromonas sp.]|uniref:SDR family NAD(P)-dependent oxidoreductase n=1 Tax=Pseudoalteromonas sp. TaxID=53249 RepID=UPI00356367B8
MKKSLIIGAGGIGLAVAEQLYQDKQHSITIITSNKSLVNDKRFNVMLVEDHSEEQVASCLATLSIQFDWVFCCLGMLHQDDIQPEKNLSQWRVESAMALMHANAFAPLTYLVHLQKRLAANCKLAFLSARVGSISDNRLGGWYSYRMAKAALNMAIKTASVELARRNKEMCVFAFHPGTTDTNLSKPFQRNVPANKLFTAEFSAECLIRLMSQVNVKDSGRFLAWDGQEIEW